MAIRNNGQVYDLLRRIHGKLESESGRKLTKKQRYKISIDVVDITAMLVEPQASKRQQDNGIAALQYALRILQGQVDVDKKWRNLVQ